VVSTPLPALDDEADRVEVGAGGAGFLPYLSGQRAPDLRPDATGTFFGLRARHGRAELFRAVLEGSAHAIRAVYDQVRGWCRPPAHLAFTGTGSTSALWRTIVADVLGEPVAYTDAAVEGRGAAVFAGVALGYHPDVDTAAAAMVRPAGVADPDPTRVERYRELHERWRAVDNALRSIEGDR
jgi:xylulokinase